MSEKERQRYHLLKMVIGGKSTLKETGSLKGVSCRQAKRLKKKLISEGTKGLIHGNRGRRPSPKALSSQLAEKILELSLSKYSNFKDTHFTERLKEEKITVGRDTVRRLRWGNGYNPKGDEEQKTTTNENPLRCKKG